MMNGCEFLRKKGEELNWDHHKLFRYFKLQIEPYTGKIKDTCCAMLQFFHSIKNSNIQLTEDIERHYELFMDIYHYQHFIDVTEDIIPPIEVQLMWIVHSLDPGEYYKDCHRKFKKLLDVKILSLYTSTNNDQYLYNQEIPYLSEFEHYLKTKLNTNVFSPMSSVTTLNSMYTNHTKETQHTWFIHNLHMKNSILQQIEFINKINYISKFNTFNDRNMYKSMHRYFKFLYLMALPMDKRPPICIPTIDIDLIWHAHILNINDYHSISKFLFPTIDIIPHNHSMAQILQKQNRQITEIFWDKIFGPKDYLDGRPFYIMFHDAQFRKKRKIIRNQTPRHAIPPSAPVALSLDVTPSVTPSASPEPIKITRIDNCIDNSVSPAHIEGDACIDDEDTKTIQTEISIQMLMNSKNETNCYWPCELCKDCCLWSFKTYRRANIGIICCIAVIILLLLTLMCALIFIPTDPITSEVIVKLYDNNVVINQNFSVMIHSRIVYDVKNNIFNENKLVKSIAYEIDGIKEDFIRFNGEHFVTKPYVNDDYYYIDINIKDEKYEINLNYSLSDAYLCCNNDKCDEIGLLMPWVNKWEYPLNVKAFNMNVVYNNDLIDLLSVYSSWDGYNYNENNRTFYLSTDKINVDKDFNVYFKLLFNNKTNFVDCSTQSDYFIYDDAFAFKQENTYHTIMTVFDFILISLSTIIFMICSCYACWWIMYLFDKSFCCDLCNVILM